MCEVVVLLILSIGCSISIIKIALYMQYINWNTKQQVITAIKMIIVSFIINFLPKIL